MTKRFPLGQLNRLAGFVDVVDRTWTEYLVAVAVLQSIMPFAKEIYDASMLKPSSVLDRVLFHSANQDTVPGAFFLCVYL